MDQPFPAYQGDELYVFVCYAHDDSAVVYSEMEYLRDQGINLWYDEGISPGEKFTDELAKGIDTCDTFLFFASPNSVASRNCQNEIQYATARDKRVVAVHIEPTTLPPGLELSIGLAQAIMKHELSPEAYRRKISDVFEVSNTPHELPTSPITVARSRRWSIFGTVLVAVALVSGAAYLNRSAVMTWLVVNAPRVLADPVEQQIAFTETSDGVRIAYATSGVGHPLVVVNGFATHLTEGVGSPLYDMGGFLRWYSRDHLTVRYDGRGFGLSERAVDDFSLDVRVADLEAVVDALGLQRFALYGYSAGGVTAIAYATRHPERVSHLVLTATFAAAAETMDPRIAFELADFIRSNWDEPTARGAIAEGLAPEASQVERRVLMHFLQTAADGPAIAGFMATQWEIDVADQAREIRVPTLVVAGDADPAVPMDATRRLASLVPGARFEILEGVASHTEAATADPRLLQMVADFLAADP